MPATRHPHFDYLGFHRYFLTLCCRERAQHFVEKQNVQEVLNFLKSTSQKFDFRIWAYCFMPDHLHFLAEGLETSANLKIFIRNFKQMTSFHFRKHCGENLWQRSYHDHILRKEENLYFTCRYILENPVRDGLVKDYRDYPFSGSLAFDWKQFHRDPGPFF